MPRNENKEKDKKLELKEKLKEKLRIKNLERTPRFIRNKKLDQLEERLDNCKSLSERRKIKKEIEILEDIQEREEDYNNDFADYGDNCSYGGQMEHPN